MEYFVWPYVENLTNLPQHQSQPDRRHPPIIRSQFRIRIEAVIEAEGGYIE